MIGLVLRFLMTAVLLLGPTIADQYSATRTALFVALVFTCVDGQDSEMLRGPTIIKPNSSEIILQTGDNFTMLCVGNRPLQFLQQELPEENIGRFKMEQRTGKSEKEYWVSLDLYDVDPFAVGYYACYYDTVNSTDVLGDLFEEPNNTAHVAYTYVYVNGSDLFAPMRTFVIAKSDSRFFIECKPTTPDIKVKLTLDFADVDYELYTYNPKLGFMLDSDVQSNEFTIVTCSFEKQDMVQLREVIVQHIRTEAPRPTIYGGLPYFLKGESFTINCTVHVTRNVPIVLSWSIPGSWEKVSNASNAYDMSDILYKNITIHEATREDAGNYTCISSSNQAWKNSSSFFKTYLDAPVLKVSKSRPDPVVDRKRQKITKIIIDIDQVYPPATVSVIRDNVIIPNDGIKYKMYPEKISYPLKFQLTVLNLGAEDTGTYIFKVSNGYLQKNISYYLTVKDRPKVDFGTHEDKKYTMNTVASLRCDAIGTPLPEIQWIFTDKDGVATVIDKNHQEDENNTAYHVKSNFKFNVTIFSGTVTCNASNEEGYDAATRRFLVNELPDGFGVKNADKLWFPEGDNVTVSCLASKYDFNNVTWYDEYDQELFNVVKYQNTFSLVAELKMPSINIRQAGVYTCSGSRNNGTDERQTVNLNVSHIQPPLIEGSLEESLDVAQFEKVNMTCVAQSVPPPSIEWYKDGVLLDFDENVQNETILINRTSLNSTVKIYPMQNDYAGTYECRVTSKGNPMQSKYYNLLLKEPITHITTYLCVAGVIFFLLILLVVYLTWKIRKEKQFRKELAAAGLLYFKEGVTKSINPDIGIDEQAELLPYDERFEFPPDKLHLGKQLGAGAFGVVYKAEARGIINAEETTIVAVKMVKKTADNMYIKALASELKIMVHLGKHINIVNLLGACTKKVGKRELIVIVEYCKFGNIHNYLQKHREVFIDQLTNNSEKTLGNVNRGFSSSSGNSGMHSDYFGSNHTQDTFLNTANTNRSTRKDNQNKKESQNKHVESAKVSESGYVQPEWRSNYESDYSFDGRSCRPLCSRDLLAWAFQIARGMEYLASRKVLHGDLAARNILLAEDNIVKICDFGLARSIYKNDEYQKQENSPLPVKWLAIECMTDRIFSTQSDVWSFGIVLWELFSLAKTPYPNISPPSLLQWLSEGHRLEKPTYADDKLYDIMQRCWSSKPTARPSFTQLQETLGSFLEDNVRNHYVDLNATYMDMNAKKVGEEDYLAMVSAPDYNNLVTPSPHHYVNDMKNFFPSTPTQLQHDEEGYLQMSPASRQTIFARPQGTKFDFDARLLTSRASEANSCGSESTPMLTLNNLPRSGSESDQEGNISPYMNMCPKIEEETDDVFGVKENNIKNTPLSVTNPQYIALSVEDEKKQHNYPNSYVNINVPNGLVK